MQAVCLCPLKHTECGPWKKAFLSQEFYSCREVRIRETSESRDTAATQSCVQLILTDRQSPSPPTPQTKQSKTNPTQASYRPSILSANGEFSIPEASKGAGDIGSVEVTTANFASFGNELHIAVHRAPPVSPGSHRTTNGSKTS